MTDRPWLIQTEARETRKQGKAGSNDAPKADPYGGLNRSFELTGGLNPCK